MATNLFYKQIEDLGTTNRPVQEWNPSLSGQLDCIIKHDGSWFIDGEQVNNMRLIKLFASVLKYEQGNYYLVTPVEKWQIQVEDLPFILVSLTTTKQNTTEQSIQVRTNLGDLVIISPQHPINTSEIKNGQALQLIPYVHIRNGLTARFNRSTFIELADLLHEDKNNDCYNLTSSGHTFCLRL